MVAVVLPPKEGFGPGRAGAVALLVHRLARVLPALVVGGPQSGPVFDDTPFRPARPSLWRLGNINTRYAAGVARLLRPLRPALIEVHNRVEVARALSRQFAGTPVSLFLHNDPQTMRGAATPEARAALLRGLARVVTVSEFLRNRLTEGVPSEAAPAPLVLPNAIDLAALPSPPDERERLILFVGRVVAEKGTDLFVAACAQALPHLPGWRAEVIGADRSRTDSPDTPFVRAVRRAATAGGVWMLGYRDHPAVLEAMSRAAIVVVPSRWPEPFGLTALEAMACGAALVAARRGGLPEVAGDAALYVDPEDAADLAAAITRLARDPEARARMGASGRARARRFGLETAAARLGALRHEILAERRAGG
ncbi:MAG: glycosyltransferase family 4 protein [Acetobacteraceae bacterium]|nr:glycosyltransferase family 4 protein [Acetobacteraceae bacterium]